MRTGEEMKKVVLIIGVACAIMLGACAIGLALTMSADPDKGGAFVTPTTTSAPGASHSGVAAKPKVPTIGPGIWQVGPDVKPGKYKTPGASDSAIPMCYWDVRKGSEEGEIGAQGVTNEASAQGVVTLAKGQWFNTSGCKPWTLVK